MPSELLSLVHDGWNHLKLQRPLAAWASWQRALRLDPTNLAASQALDRLAAAAELPAVAREVYRFATPIAAARRERWDDRLRQAEGTLDDLEVALKVFAGLAAEDPTDADARFNSALCLAWLGRNGEAIEALGQAVDLLAASDPARAAGAWALAEALRFGAGAEGYADDLSFTRVVDGFDSSWLDSLPNLKPMELPPVPGAEPAAGVHVFEWLDKPMPAASGLAVSDLPRCLASVVVLPRSARFSGPVLTGLDALDDLPRPLEALARAIASARKVATPLPLAWADAALGTFRYPPNLDGRERTDLARGVVEHEYENLWIHTPRQGLDRKTPLEAARAAVSGDASVAARLAGLVLFREQLGARPTHADIYQGYPFDRLRRRVGLPAIDPENPGHDAEDFACMGEAELHRLDPNSLAGPRLIDAFHSAEGLRVDPLMARFAARLLDGEPSRMVPVDFRNVAAPLVREALKAGSPAGALEWLEKARAVAPLAQKTALTVWMAEVHARGDDPDAALQTYQSLPAETSPAVLLDAATFLLDNGYPGHARPLAIEAGERALRVDDSSSWRQSEVLLDLVEG